MTEKTFNDVYNQISSIVNDAYSKLGNDILIKTPYGTVVFNKYVIVKISNGYQVYVRQRFDIHEFGSARNALIWIILDHHSKVNESKRVKELDCFLSSSIVDSKIHAKKKKDVKSIDEYLIHSSKLQWDLEKQKQFLNEIDKYHIIAQKCQKTRTIK